MKRLLRVSFVLVFVLGFAVIGVAEQPRKGGTVTWSVHSSPPTLDWHVTSARATEVYVGMYVWEGLTAMDAGYQPQPMLADSWEVSPNGLKWTFHLRKGVLFHNLKEMTSEDVVASFKRYLEVSPRKSILAPVSDIVATDKYTVEFLLKSPLAMLPYICMQENAQPVIHPKEIIEGAPANELPAYIGTGPYKLGEWIPGTQIVLERFDKYVSRDDIRDGLAGRKVPYLDRIVFKSIPESQVRLAGLLTGEFQGSQPLPGDYWDQVEQAPGVHPVSYTDMKPFVYFSTHENAITKNPKLRQALRIALDMDEIMFAATNDERRYEVNPDQLFFRGQTWWSETTAGVVNQKNIELAKKLAEEAGYKGERIRFVASVTSFHHRRPALILTEQLREAGFNVQLDLRDWPTVAKVLYEPEKWDMWYARIVFFSPNDLEQLKAGGFDSPEMQAFLDTLNTESDPGKLQQAVEKLKRDVIIEQVPLMTFGDMFGLGGVSDKLKGVQKSYFHPLWNAWLED